MVCIDEAERDDTPIKHDPPALPPREDNKVPTLPATEISKPTNEGFSTGSEVMDDILEHSLQRMLEAIDHLAKRVDVLARAEKTLAPATRKDGVQAITPGMS